MPFDSADPRAALMRQTSALPTAFAEPQLIPFADETAEGLPRGSRQWHVRIQHAVVVFAEAVAGETWVGSETSETLVVAPVGPTVAAITRGGDVVTAESGSVVVVPAGASVIESVVDGPLIRVFPAVDRDLIGRCLNAGCYADPAPNVAAYVPGPGPDEMLVYRLDDYPPTVGRFGHIFRSANLMVNFIATRIGPRDPTKLSPHSHADFEQCSLQLGGEFVHHVRTPWTPDMTNWRPDRDLELTGAGAVIFPPPLEHTSRAVGNGPNRLIDVFAPPRLDFLGMDGWVLNSADFE